MKSRLAFRRACVQRWLLAVLVSNLSIAACQSAPSWSHFHADLRNTGYFQVHSPRELVQKWTYPVGGTGFGSPAIGPDGTIFIGNGSAQVFAINPDGTLKWQWDGTLEAQELITNSVAVAEDGSVYVVCQSFVKDGRLPFTRASSTLFRLEDEGTKATKTWDLPLTDLGFCRSSPKVWRRGSMAQVFLQFHSLGGEHLLLVVNARGKLIHRESLNCSPTIGPLEFWWPADPWATGPFGGHDGLIDVEALDPYQTHFLMSEGHAPWWPPDPTPAVVDSASLDAKEMPIIVVASQCSVQALQWDPVGLQMTRLWEDPQPPHFYASPAVGEDGNVFVARDDDHLVAYDRYGNRLWTEDFVGANDFISSPALFPFLNAAFFVYVPTRERMYKVNAGNGALFEEHPVTYATCASPAITLDRVYVGTPGGLLSMDFFLGDLQKDATVEVQNASPAIGADGSVYIVTRKGDLIAYRNPEEL